MAPVCLSACRLACQFLNARLAVWLSMFLLLPLFTHCVDAIITYGRQILLHIRSSLETQSKDCPITHDRFHSTFSHLPVTCVRRLPCCIIYQRKRRRKRGNHGGIRVRIRREFSSTQSSRCSSTLLTGHNGLYLTRRSWDVRFVNHRPIVPDQNWTPDYCAPARLCVQSRGVNLQNLIPLKYVRQSQIQTVHCHVKMALVNARSVSNKTFILNDFFTSRGLDFLFLTETWTGADESSIFGELCPLNCSFISTPRCVRRGGGVTMVFRNQYKIQTIFAENFSTFKSQCVLIESPTTQLLCVLVYRPPKPDKDFIKEFSDFISHIITLYDHLLILGDFNIHVCCPGKPMVTEFTHVLDSFDCIQHVDKATHVLGHTLDLVMSYGFPIDNISIEDASFSDHKPIVFNVILSSLTYAAKNTSVYSCCINSLTANQFSDLYKTNDVSTAILAAAEQSSSPENFIYLFNSSSSAILDSVAPFKYKSPKCKSQPWLDDTTRSFRQICRKAERRWKKYHLTVSFEIFKNSLVNFQKAARKARAKFFSDIISKYSHTLKILFSTIN